MGKCNNKKFAGMTLALLLLTSAFSIPAMAMEVPVSSTSAEVNGQQILTEVYEDIPADLDPQTLVKEDFTKNSYIYTFDKITKENSETIEKKTVTQDISVPATNKKLEDNIGLLDAYVEYTDEDGFEGNLYLDPNSVRIDADGYSSKSWTETETKTYPGLEYNDPSLVPSTIEKNGKTMTVTGVQWQEEAMLEDGTIPASYTAVATYARNASASYATGYTMTASYSGEVEKTDDGVLSYTIVYTGSDMMPEEIISSGSGFFGNMSSGQAVLTSILSLAGIGLIAFAVIMLLKKRGKKDGSAPMSSVESVSSDNK